MAAERLSWLARNGRRRVPALAGWQAQGKKVSPPPLRQGDRGFAVLRRDQAIERRRGSRAREPCKEKTRQTWIRARGQAPRAKEQKPWRTERRSSHPGLAERSHCRHRGLPALRTAVPLERSIARTALFTVRFDDQHPPITQPETRRSETSAVPGRACHRKRRPQIGAIARPGLGRDQERHARPCRGSYRDGANQRKNLLPQLSRHAKLR